MLLHSIFLWYITEDLVEDIDESLETCNLEEKVLPLTLSKLSGEDPEINRSFLCNSSKTQLVIESFVENVYLKKIKLIYSPSLLWALPYKMVVQEKEEALTVCPHAPCNKLLI